MLIGTLLVVFSGVASMTLAVPIFNFFDYDLYDYDCEPCTDPSGFVDKLVCPLFCETVEDCDESTESTSSTSGSSSSATSAAPGNTNPTTAASPTSTTARSPTTPAAGKK